MNPRFVDAVGLLGGGILAYFTLGYVASRFKATPGPGPDAPAPDAPVGPTPGRGKLVIGKTLTINPGRTYFVTLSLHHAANAATKNQAKAEAEKRGFTDVVVFSTGEQPAPWPLSRTTGDFAVRGTYSGTAPKTMASSEGGFVGSVDVLEAFEA